MSLKLLFPSCVVFSKASRAESSFDQKTVSAHKSCLLRRDNIVYQISEIRDPILQNSTSFLNGRLVHISAVLFCQRVCMYMSWSAVTISEIHGVKFVQETFMTSRACFAKIQDSACKIDCTCKSIALPISLHAANKKRWQEDFVSHQSLQQSLFYIFGYNDIFSVFNVMMYDDAIDDSAARKSWSSNDHSFTVACSYCFVEQCSVSLI